MADCPNCGTDLAARDDLCPACGFDVHSGAAEEVRRLRLEGRIEPGRIGAQPRGEAPGAERVDAGL